MKYLSLLIVGLIAFTACKKEEEADTTKPKINITAPANESEFHPGDNLVMTGTITDNKELGSFRYEIHESEGHEHKSTRGDGHDHGWEVDMSKNISGTSYSINETVAIPADADTGDYHIIINALDKAGNAATFVEVDFHVHKD